MKGEMKGLTAIIIMAAVCELGLIISAICIFIIGLALWDTNRGWSIFLILYAILLGYVLVTGWMDARSKVYLATAIQTALPGLPYVAL